MARLGVAVVACSWLLQLLPLVGAACPDACACFRDARLWLALPREDSLTARCARRGLTALPAGVDGDVRHLDVSGNWLARLDAGAFVQMGQRRLLSLDASSNVLDDVRPGAFRGLTALRRVSLAYNRLQTLPADLFAEAPDLWALSLAGNPLLVPALGAQPSALLSAPALRLLDVSDCKLRVFPDGLLGAGNALQELIAARNGFAEVRVALLRHLRRLDVSDNHLRLMPSDALREAPQLRSLVLDGNALRLSNGSALVSSPSLRSLSAARCGLSALHGDVFADAPSLEEVSLETNGLTALPPDAFSSLPALQRLNLRANRLERLPKGIFARNAALRALDLSHNHLDADLLLSAAEEESSGPWLEVTSLRELSLSHCGLRALPAALFVGVPSLRNLSASGNFLSSVEAQLLEPLPKLRALDLRENPLHCDAKLHALWLAVQARHVRTVATCLDPPGDWEMLRFFGSSNAMERVTAASNQSFTDPTTSEEESANVIRTAAISDALIENSVRWGPPIGVIVFAVVLVFAFRKWINRMNGKGDDDDPYARDFAYESDEDETVNMTLTTDGGTPRVTPSRGSVGSRFAVSCVGDEAPLTDPFVDPASPHRPRLSVGR